MYLMKPPPPSPRNTMKLGLDIKTMASAKLAMALFGDDQGKKAK